MKSILAVLFLSVSTFSLPLQALACSCTEPASIEQAFNEASLVFLGRVKKIRENPLRKGQREVTFAITTLFKDDTETEQKLEQVLIYTPMDEAMCGVNFAIEFDYLVFANGTPAHYKTNLCMNNKAIDIATDDVKELEKLTNASQAESAQLPMPQSKNRSLGN
ncbi:MAG: hypothetical protein IT291_00040 [Deltaproteobacteria bacterium]|nr:hypothetical protein [Deltaproteobacteria bacterium]